jgi:hypothetical protein
LKTVAFKLVLSPIQIESVPLIVATGTGAALIVNELFFTHPLASVTVRLYEPGTRFKISSSVEPVLHK